MALSPEQIKNARIIRDVGASMGMPRRAIVIAIMAAMQESSLRNLNYGDRDSLGLFQQRPSQGWGTRAQVTNPKYAARKFFQTLKGVRGWEKMSRTAAAQAVQRSAYPSAYAKHFDLAKNVLSQIGGTGGGAGGGGGKSMPMGKEAQKILAADYGFAYRTLKNNPQLSKIFAKAVKNNWEPERFLAAVRDTQWYRTRAESVRNAIIQKTADPATYKRNVQQRRAEIRAMTGSTGARLTGKQWNTLAEQAYRQGWDQNEVQQHLARFVKAQSYNGQYHMAGQAGEWERNWREYADKMGVTISRKSIQSWAQMATSGKINAQDPLNRIRAIAVSKYPHLKERINSGETLDDIAAPYRQTMGELLEKDPDAIGLGNALLKKALSSHDSKGNPMAMPLWKFEDEIRKTSEWQYTDNAREEANNVLNQFGEAFGKMV